MGHAETWDELEMDGEVAARDCAVRYERGGHVFAVASIGRDMDSLKAEATMEFKRIYVTCPLPPYQ